MPSKVAFLLPHFGHGGAEGVVLRLLRGIDRDRYTPVLLLQHRRGELLDLVPADVPVISLRHSRPPGCIPEIARLYARIGVALAVTVTNATNLYSVLAAKLSRADVRTLVTEHTPLSVFLSDAKFPGIRRLAIQRIFSQADLTGGPIDQIGTELSDMLGPAAPPFVSLPNPVVDHVGALRPLSDQACHVVSLGRLAPEKRFDLLIHAFAQLQKTLPHSRLTIHGEGSERAALEAQIRKAGLDAKVMLPGYTADLDAVHSKADLFVCTSRREGLGNAIIEAMARGVPVVSVDCPYGPRLILRAGAAGWLEPEHTPAAIAHAMSSVLTDKTLRTRYVEAGFAVARDYQVDTAVAAYEAAFDRAISKNPDRGKARARAQ